MLYLLLHFSPAKIFLLVRESPGFLPVGYKTVLNFGSIVTSIVNTGQMLIEERYENIRTESITE